MALGTETEPAGVDCSSGDVGLFPAAIAGTAAESEAEETCDSKSEEPLRCAATGEVEGASKEDTAIGAGEFPAGCAFSVVTICACVRST